MRLLQLLMFVITVSFSQAALADVLPEDVSPVHFDKAHAYQTAPSQTNGAVFFNVQNLLKKNLKIISAASDVAEVVELHTHSMDGDNMMMYPVEAFDLPAGKTHELKPTGDHIMLMLLKAPLVAGETFDVQVTLDTGDVLTVPVMINSLVD